MQTFQESSVSFTGLMFTISPQDFPDIHTWLKDQNLDNEWCVTHYLGDNYSGILVFIKDEYLAVMFNLRANDLFVRSPRTIKNGVVLRSLLIDCERQKGDS